MTQHQIDTRLSHLRVFLDRLPQERDRILREIHFLEDMWMEIELANSSDEGEEDIHHEFEPPY